MKSSYLKYTASFLIICGFVTGFLKWSAVRHDFISPLEYFLNVGTPLILAWALWAFAKKVKREEGSLDA